MQLIAPLARSLSEENYHTPTPIQLQAIPPALDGYDVLGCAQTGTGKTAAFALPILDELGREPRRATPRRPFALILAPTRELAIQIGESLDVYGRHLKLRSVVVFGGVKQHAQVRALQQGVHILVATPGRLLDLIDQGHIDLKDLEIFVLDEADRMLDMGFMPDIKRILRLLPEDRQSLFFSATLPPKIVELADRLLFEPVRVSVKPDARSVDLISQTVYWTNQTDKQDVLHRVLMAKHVGRTIVFTRTKRRANQVGKRLQQAGISTATIHGNKSQAARQRALQDFRDDHIQVLVATDVAARGIDVDGITHVINFDVPVDPESYVHRIGRTGRAGADGIAITFCTADQHGELRDIERQIGMQIPVDPAYKRPPRSGTSTAERNGSGQPPQRNQGRRSGGGQSGRSRSRRSFGKQRSRARAAV
jgi:ATP-dependent RNA helicase RhlE